MSLISLSQLDVFPFNSDDFFFFLFCLCCGHFQEYKRKLAKVTQVRKELRSRLNNLPGGLYNSSNWLKFNQWTGPLPLLLLNCLNPSHRCWIRGLTTHTFLFLGKCLSDEGFFFCWSACVLSTRLLSVETCIFVCPCEPILMCCTVSTL